MWEGQCQRHGIVSLDEQTTCVCLLSGSIYPPSHLDDTVEELFYLFSDLAADGKHPTASSNEDDLELVTMLSPIMRQLDSALLEYDRARMGDPPLTGWGSDQHFDSFKLQLERLHTRFKYFKSSVGSVRGSRRKVSSLSPFANIQYLSLMVQNTRVELRTRPRPPVVLSLGKYDPFLSLMIRKTQEILF